MALTQSSTPDPAPSASHPLPTTPQAVRVPAPQLFDVLPQLHEILARVDHASAAGEPEHGEPDDVGARYTDQQPLDPKDLPTAILPLKAQIRKALRELEKLPGMDRTVHEQDEEIAELEERRRRQEEMMKQMGATGKAMQVRLGAM